MTKEDLDLLEEQRNNIQEVWFDGYHSDIGGGSGHNASTIALRWMLGEATSIRDPIRLSEDGMRILDAPDPTPNPNESDHEIYRELSATMRDTAWR